MKQDVKRLIKLINSGSVKGNRLYDLQQTDTYKSIVNKLKL